MKTLRTIFFTVIALLTIGLLGGCTTDTNSQDNKALESVRVGIFPNITHAQALIGKSQGTFQKKIGDQVPIDWQVFNAGSLEIEAMLAEEVDLGYIGPGPAINGYAKSRGDIVIIAGSVDGGAVLVAGKNSNIHSVKDLSGKRVAIPQFGNTQDLTLRAVLKQNKLKDTTKGGTVEIMQAQNPDIKTLLDQKQIDAALVPEPWGSRLVKEVGAKIVLDNDQLWRNGNYPTALIIARKDFIKKHPDVVKNFLAAHVELTKWTVENPEEAKKIVNNEIKNITQKALPKEVLDTSFTRLKLTTEVNQQAVQEMVDLSVQTGFLRKKPDLTSLYELNLLKEVR